MPTVEEILSQFPEDGADATAGPAPIGVPKDYTITRTEQGPFKSGSRARRVGGGLSIKTRQEPTFTAGRTTNITPLYFEGDEIRPASQGPREIVRIQEALLDAGLFTKKTRFQKGLWDEPTIKAYGRLLAFANTMGVDKDKALARYKETYDPAQDAEEGEPRKPLRIELTNPADLRAVFETVARRRIGRKLAPAEVDRYVASYQGQEKATQTEAYNEAETGGTVVRAPDPQAFLADRIAKEYGVEAGAHSLAETGNDFLDLLKEVGG